MRILNGPDEPAEELFRTPAKTIRAAAEMAAELASRFGAETGSEAFGTFRNGLGAMSERPLRDDELVDYLVEYSLARPAVDLLFAGYPHLDLDPCRRLTDAFLAAVGAVPARDGPCSKVYDEIGARLADPSRTLRQGVICGAMETVCRLAAARDRNLKFERYGVVFTPVEIVDFIIRSTAEALARELGRDPADPEVGMLDPFAGVGVFTARIIDLSIPDDRLAAKYDFGLFFKEINPMFWHVANLNVEEAFWTRTGGVHGWRPFKGGKLTDTFMDRGGTPDAPAGKELAA